MAEWKEDRSNVMFQLSQNNKNIEKLFDMMKKIEILVAVISTKMLVGAGLVGLVVSAVISVVVSEIFRH